MENTFEICYEVHRHHCFFEIICLIPCDCSLAIGKNYRPGVIVLNNTEDLMVLKCFEACKDVEALGTHELMEQLWMFLPHVILEG